MTYPELPEGYWWDTAVPGLPHLRGPNQLYAFDRDGSVSGTTYPPPDWVAEKMRQMQARIMGMS